MKEEKYINPFTDFGFKKLFTEEQKFAYEESMKYYRDLKNVIDKSYDEGKSEGKKEREIQIAKNAKNEGLSIEVIMKLTGLSK
jgi:predicted transposase/invertase (TIGR01784 family)